MALRYRAAAAQAEGLTTQGKNLLCTLADNCNEEGRALPVWCGWQGVMGVSARTYQRAMKELRERGLVEIPPPGQEQIIHLYLDPDRLAPMVPVRPSQMEARLENLGAGDAPKPLPDNVSALVPACDGITDDTVALQTTVPVEELADALGIPIQTALVEDAAELYGEGAISDDAPLEKVRDLIVAVDGGARLLQVGMAYHGHVDADALNEAAEAWAEIEAEESAVDGDGVPDIMGLMPAILHAATLALAWVPSDLAPEHRPTLTEWLTRREYDKQIYQCPADSLPPSERPQVDEAALLAELNELQAKMGKFCQPRAPNETMVGFEKRVRARLKVLQNYQTTTGEPPP